MKKHGSMWPVLFIECIHCDRLVSTDRIHGFEEIQEALKKNGFQPKERVEPDDDCVLSATCIDC